jgi:hypothetical protein
LQLVTIQSSYFAFRERAALKACSRNLLMATYIIAGPADSVDYAKLDRLADLLVARHAGSVKIVKLRKHPSVWPEVRNNIKDTIG